MQEVVERSRTKEPSIAGAALSPYNGEGGLFLRRGSMRSRPRWTMPARRAIRAAALSRQTPCFPSYLQRGCGGDLQHHDQANIARKLHGFIDRPSAF